MSIVRRHHPLYGQVFDVLMGGNELITIQVADGSPMRIPRRWTDADGAQPVRPNREGFFVLESLRRLIDLVEALASRQ